MNSIHTISPYKYNGQWVFDDASKELDKEPFIAGMDLMIDKWTEDIPNADKGFILIASADPFPGHTIKLTWVKAFAGGNWYVERNMQLIGWLCPALLKYFDKAPMHLYVQVKGK